MKKIIVLLFILASSCAVKKRNIEPITLIIKYETILDTMSYPIKTRSAFTTEHLIKQADSLRKNRPKKRVLHYEVKDSVRIDTFIIIEPSKPVVIRILNDSGGVAFKQRVK